MRIGYFTAIDGWGGSEMYLKTMMLSLRQEGHDPVLIGIEGTRLFGELQAEGVECVGWKKSASGVLRKVDSEQRADVRQYSASSSLINKTSYLKVVLLGLLPGWVKLLAGNIKEVIKLRGILFGLKIDVLQVTVHGYEVAGLAGRLNGIPTIAVYQISPVSEPSRFCRFLIRWTAKSYHRVCFVSYYSAVEWRKVTGLKPARCEVVPNGADLHMFEGGSRATSLAVEDAFRLVSVGRLHPMKGYRYLVEAMAYLNDPTVSLDILGEGEDDAELHELAHRLGVENTIRFRGHVDNPVDYLKKADCFVLASVSHEGSPFVLAEAMAAGLPLITSDYGPLPEINIHNKTGIVVPARDSRALAAAIRAQRGNQELSRQMGLAGLERSVQYDQHQMVAKMLTQYKLVQRMAQ